jgi:hypothetical protein
LTVLTCDLDVPDQGIANYVNEFLKDPHWIRRLVDTVSFLDYDTLHRRSTVDLEMSTLMRMASTLPFDNECMLVPLAILKKNLLADFDLRDGSGRALTVVPRNLDTYFAWSFLCARAGTALGVAMSEVPRPIRAHLSFIAYRFPDVDDNPFSGPVRSWNPPLVWSVAMLDTWSRLVEQEEFARFLTDFTFSYLLVTQLNFECDVQIVKYSHQQSPNLNAASLSGLIGIVAAEFIIEAPSVGWGRSYHLQIEPPNEMVVTGIFLERYEAVNVPEPTNDAYDTQVGDGFAQVHTGGSIPSGDYHARLLMRVQLPGYLRSLWLSTIFTSLVLFLGDIFLGRLQRAAHSDVEGAVALLLVAPSLITAYLVRPGEHAIASSLLRVHRYLAGTSGLLTYLAAAALVLNWKGFALREIWSIVTSMALLIAVILTVGVDAARNDTRDLNALVGRTYQDFVYAVPRAEPLSLVSCIVQRLKEWSKAGRDWLLRRARGDGRT